METVTAGGVITTEISLGEEAGGFRWQEEVRTAFSPNGRYLVVASEKGTFSRIVDVQEPTNLHTWCFFRHPGRMKHVLIDDIGVYCVIVHEDGHVCVYNRHPAGNIDMEPMQGLIPQEFLEDAVINFTVDSKAGTFPISTWSFYGETGLYELQQQWGWLYNSWRLRKIGS